MKLCQVQMKVTADKAENLARAARLIRDAGAADIVVLPEMFSCPYVGELFARYAEEEGGETCQFLSALAKERGIYLVGGTVPERCDGKIYNTCYV